MAMRKFYEFAVASNRDLTFSGRQTQPDPVHTCAFGVLDILAREPKIRGPEQTKFPSLGQIERVPECQCWRAVSIRPVTEGKPAEIQITAEFNPIHRRTPGDKGIVQRRRVNFEQDIFGLIQIDLLLANSNPLPHRQHLRR